MFKISIKYAGICSLFLIIIFHVSDYFGIHPLINVAHLVFDLSMFGLFIFFATKEFKTDQENNILHFWQGMTIGFNVYFFATCLFTVWLALYFEFSGDALANYQTVAREFLLEKKDVYIDRIGAEVFDQQLKEIDQATTGDLLTSSALKKILAGFFITPVISIILRKQPK